jgi:hypothetical protein
MKIGKQVKYFGVSEWKTTRLYSEVKTQTKYSVSLLDR